MFTVYSCSCTDHTTHDCLLLFMYEPYNSRLFTLVYVRTIQPTTVYTCLCTNHITHNCLLLFMYGPYNPRLFNLVYLRTIQPKTVYTCLCTDHTTHDCLLLFKYGPCNPRHNIHFNSIQLFFQVHNLPRKKTKNKKVFIYF